MTVALGAVGRAASAWEIWLGSLPSALLAITWMLGSSACTAAMKSGLSWCSKRSAQVEQGIRKAILRVLAGLAGLEPHATKNSAAMAMPQVMRKRVPNISLLL